MEKIKAIKLLVCYHKPDILLQDEVFTPIHVGRALAKKRMKSDDKRLKWLLENMIGDDTGDNISEQNASYNELTSLYWAWKNYDKLDNPDYIGLMHYRRHFVFNEGEITVYNMPDMDSEHYFDFLNYSPKRLSKLMSDCDFACHLGNVDVIYKHYLANHRIEDIELAMKILDEKYPQYSEIGREYLQQNIGNFCNMFIFPKEMFFEYCEFIFSILEEFARKTDVSEKRFFISERLTGIFIYEKIKKGLKYKVFPINFVAEKIDIPIAYPINEKNLYAILTSVVSVLENADKNTSFTFYMVHGRSLNNGVKQKFNFITQKYPYCRFEFIQSDLRQEYYPLEISERLPKVNKLIYFNEKVIAMHDLAEFFRTCSVDDYYISGMPETYAINESEKRAVAGEIFMINCARFRKYEIYKQSLDMTNGSTALQIINKLCRNNIGYFAEWFITFAGSSALYEHTIISKAKSRAQLQIEATWRPVLYFGENEPWQNIQGVYSIFWWNFTTKVPFLFDFIKTEAFGATDLLNKQQRELNHIGGINRGICGDDLANCLPKDTYNIMAVCTESSAFADKCFSDYQKSLKSLEEYEIHQMPAAKSRKKKNRRKLKRKFENATGEHTSVWIRVKRYYYRYGYKKTFHRIVQEITGKQQI